MSKSEKRYYWLKLKEDFFYGKAIKKLRKIAGGDTYVIIYLKMQLLSLKTEGFLYYEGVEGDFCSELALDLDEDVDNVRITLTFLQAQGLLEQREVDSYYMANVEKSIGSESDSAERVRRFREKKKLEIESHELHGVDSLQDEIDKLAIIEARPSLKEVVAFSKQLGGSTDPYRFFTYYMQMGWKTKSGDPITDWKNTFRYWSANERDSISSSAAPARRKKQIPESPNADAYRSLVYNLDEDGSSDRGVPYPETNG